MKNMKRVFLSIYLVVVATVHAEDEKIKEKVYLSKENQIVSVTTQSVGGSKYLVLSFKKQLDGKNSKGRAAEEKSNFGDSASTYCYKKESDIGDFERLMIIEWFKGSGPMNVMYSCGELMDEERRKSFPGFAETNCQCLEFTFKPMSTSRGMWR